MARIRSKRKRPSAAGGTATAVYGSSTEWQALCDHCAVNGWPVAEEHVYSDLDALLLAVRAHALCRVVIAGIDRLGTKVADVLAVTDDLKAHGCALVSLAEPYDIATPSGQFAMTMTIAAAELRAATGQGAS